MFELLLVIVLPFAIVLMFGRLIARPRQAYAIVAVMAAIFIGHTVVSMQAELHGNHALPASVSQVATADSPGGNMEGKETRFGPQGSALMTVGTMGTTAGATDSALDSYTPVGGAGAFVAILLGEISPGGEGGGLYSILVLALLSVFIAGLMVGRTPEFLGKKIRGPQMKLVVTYVLTIPIVVLVLGSTSLVIGPGTSPILNPGFHGLTEVTYAYASVANNNGSAFAGLAANTPWYDVTLGLAMLIGRFGPIVLALAIAGSLAGARVHARTRATLDTSGPTFAAFLLGVIVIVGGLIYFPMLILGPIGERIVG
jgi:K+-transporting ATPase ATPase A chain